MSTIIIMIIISITIILIMERDKVLMPHTEPYFPANSSGNTGYAGLLNVSLYT